VVDGYLAPILRGYLDRVRATLGAGHLHVMTSAGGLVGPESFRPKESLLSGPAGGVVGAALAGRRAGFHRVIAFDMGGTSTDVSRVDGDFEYVFEHEVGDAHLVAPALAIETVAAGGGSICWFDGQRLRVGPESAGAKPGPACYASGGPLTLTDVNLLLGRLNPDRFGIPIDPDAARERVTELIGRVEREGGETVREGDVLEGLLDVANERMADAIRRISLRRGYDPAAYALVAFGGAGAQHACAVARRLGISTVVVPPDAGLLSALGLGHAVIERFAEQQVLQPLDEVEDRVFSWLDELGRRARDDVGAEGVPASEITIRRRIAHLRFVGQDATLEVELDDGVSPRSAFEQRYQAIFGHRPGPRAIELESLRVVASSRPDDDPGAVTVIAPYDAQPEGTRSARIDGEVAEAPVFARETLQPGARFGGPAVVDEAHSTTVVEGRWRAEVDGAGSLVLREKERPRTRVEAARPEAVRLELFTNRFRTIAREMGERLRHTAISTNVKERLDFSCAVLDPEGVLIVNAPHIPVHLGALGMCVRQVRRSLALGPGDVVVTNHPGFGGSHLPDITVVTPVHLDPDPGSPLLGYVASRAHHAEIGGARPGSMPPAATSLAEEGVVIPPTLLAHAGEPRWDDLRALLEGAPYPTRAVEDNLADLRAAVAAGHAGAEALRALAGAHGVETVHSYMHALTALAERRIRDAFERIPDGTYAAEERLDDGSPLCVRLDIRGDEARIDFDGSAPVHPGNLNATPAIVASAVIYVLRLMIDEPLPLNEGFMRAISLRIPRGMLDPLFPDDPAEAPAVVGGNVETSQRIVDTLLKALGLAACSQGTMNNVLFGNDRFGYYETVCGGAGAGPGFAGASAVHTHMTNTRITDPEVLEHRYPVRVDRFAIRTGSGGGGEFRGGDGVVRELTFLEAVDLSVLTQHREVAPYGLEGGEDGSTGAQRVVRASGEIETLSSIDGCRAAPGDRLILETPGGGGYGRG
jgi:5-oxoprolinase (ATP-hydrolysing)